MSKICDTCSCNKFIKVQLPVSIEQKDVVVICERPKPAEARAGEVMVGRGGDVFRQTCKQVEISLDRIAYVSALGCAIPKIKGKKVPADAISNCHKLLVNKVKAHKPKMPARGL